MVTTSSSFSKSFEPISIDLLIFFPLAKTFFEKTIFLSPKPSSITHNYILIQPTKSLIIDRFVCLCRFHHLYFSSKYNFPVQNSHRLGNTQPMNSIVYQPQAMFKNAATRPSTRPCNARRYRTAAISSKSDKKSDSSKKSRLLNFKRLEFDVTSQIYSFYAKIDKKTARK